MSLLLSPQGSRKLLDSARRLFRSWISCARACLPRTGDHRLVGGRAVHWKGLRLVD